MASYVLVRHKVRDFASWKSGYDAHQSVRQEYGLSEEHVLNGADDPNEVVVLLKAADLGRAKAFAASSEVKEAMQKVGVVDKPDIYFLSS
jgi:hypothetical protein